VNVDRAVCGAVHLTKCYMPAGVWDTCVHMQCCKPMYASGGRVQYTVQRCVTRHCSHLSYKEEATKPQLLAAAVVRSCDIIACDCLHAASAQGKRSKAHG